jgi:hypothetical protein
MAIFPLSIQYHLMAVELVVAGKPQGPQMVTLQAAAVVLMIAHPNLAVPVEHMVMLVVQVKAQELTAQQVVPVVLLPLVLTLQMASVVTAGLELVVAFLAAH